MGLVVKLAKSFKPKNQDELEEFVQIGSFGLLKAIRVHDSTKGALTTIAWGYIRGEILHHIYALKRQVTNTRDNIEIKIDPKESLWEYLPNTLSEIESKTVMMRLSGHSFTEIGKEVGFTRNWCNRIYTKAVKKILCANETKN